MRKLAFVVVLLSLSALSLFAAETLQEFDARIEKELQALDPPSVGLWRRANAARATNDHTTALGLYATVHQRVPAFDHALRRLAGEQLAMGNRQLAIENLRKAVAQQRSPENISALASALLDGNPAPAESGEAMTFAREGVQLDPDGVFENATLAQAAIATNDLETLRKTTAHLERVAPNEVAPHVYRIAVAGAEGNWDEARAALERARAAGLPPEAYAGMRANLDRAVPFYVRWWKPAAIALGAWFGGFALLLLAGAVLSRVAMRAAKETPSDLSDNATGLGNGVRRVYRSVLFLSSLFYYVSIPIVIALVIAVGGGLIYATFALGRIPVKLVIIALILVVVTIWSILKSLFIRPRDEDPGMKVDLAQQPRLRALLDEVAGRIGTRAVDNVYLTPGADVAVMERRSKERCLILGLAALDGLALRPLKAILGHEYGHFSNRDTAGGAFALAVRNSMHATAVGLAEGGAAAWYNPAWLFVSGFNRVFLRISEGASRLQEVLADRWAVFAYGADAFETGLRHVVERGVRFDAHVNATLREVVDNQAPLANLYTYAPAKPAEDVSGTVEEALNRRTSPYDSHPTPAERFALVHALPKKGTEPESDDHEPAWALFEDPLAVQHAMTAQVRENVRMNLGVEIAAAAPA
ncbi:MAG TPA: M48 family metalloprotease [Thermoanaerobaculia bacterium]|nr:M48 family metalloprotease [Thermoanaerobaculia bacterium]